jgi:hypothetical protein
MQQKRTIKLNIKLPKGLYATSEMEAKVIEAANNAIKSFASGIEAARTAAADLQKKGFVISAEELLARRTGGRKPIATKAAKATKATKSVKATPAAAKKTRKRVVLSSKQKDEIAAALKAGKATANALAKQYGCSTATINLLKKERGLTKPRK